MNWILVIFLFVTLCSAVTAITLSSLEFASTLSKTSRLSFFSVRAASTKPLLTDALLDPLVVDSIEIQNGQYVLLKDEADLSQNGVYAYQAKTLVRHALEDHTTVFVQEGSLYRNKLFTYTSGKIVVQDTIGADNATTSEISEGTNLYHTSQRVRSSMSATNGLTYQTANGVVGMASRLLFSEKLITQGTGSNDSILQYRSINSTMTSGVDVSDSGRFKLTRSSEIDVQPVLTMTTSNPTDMIFSSNLGIGATPLNAQIQVAQGGMALNSGLTSTDTRPTLATAVGAGEIRGHGSTFSDDNGWLELTAGGGTNTNTQSTIELSGSSTVPDMDRNIVMRTAGTERVRITSTGAVTFTGSLSCVAATVASLNAGSGAIQTTGSLSGGAATVTSLNAGSGTIQTTGTVSASTATASQLRLATSGGTPSDLNYYEEASESITFTGPWASNQTTTIQYVRIGSLVSMCILGVSAVLTSSTNITSTTGIATRFRPGSNRYTNLYVINGNANIQLGVILIASNGTLTVYGTQDLGPFSNAGTVGIQRSGITYHLNGTI